MNMRFVLAAASLTASWCAHAGVAVSAGALSTDPASFLDLTTFTVTDGAVYTDPNSIPTGPGPYIAAIPWHSPSPSIVTDASKGWIAAGKSTDGQGSPAKLDLTSLGATAISFLWGSPDTYNWFTVTTTLTSNQQITAQDVQGVIGGGMLLDGNQSRAYYVTFTAQSAAETIKSISFYSEQPAGTGFNAVEVSNMVAVPEPEAYGLALAGMGVVAFAMRRRRNA